VREPGIHAFDVARDGTRLTRITLQVYYGS
jgi:hypothetical protein